MQIIECRLLDFQCDIAEVLKGVAMKNQTDIILYVGLAVVSILLIFGHHPAASSVWIKRGNRIYRDYSQAVRCTAAAAIAGLMTLAVYALANTLIFR